MALNTLKCNHLTPLSLNGLIHLTGIHFSRLSFLNFSLITASSRDQPNSVCLTELSS